MRSVRRSLLATLTFTLLAVLPAVAAEGDVNSPSLAPGDTFSHTFESAGSSYYHCHPHPWMEGRLTIEESDGSDPQTHVVRLVEPEGGSRSWRFEPAELTIRAGDTVQWVNEGGSSHQVMAWVSEDPEASPSDDHAHEHDHVEDEEAPSVAVLPLLVGLCLVALLRRR